MLKTLICVALIFTASLVHADVKLDLAGTFSSHKEQVKNDSGAASGALYSSTHFALSTSGTYGLSEIFDAGAFLFFERASRTMAPFNGVDASGAPVRGAVSGGPYSVIWIGPMVRANWKPLFLEAGYTLLGWRSDNAYGSLVSVSGNSTDAFQPDRLKAWIFGLGGTFGLAQDLELLLRLEYRFHYYSGRGGDELAGDLLLGSQAIRPYLGVRFSL